MPPEAAAPPDGRQTRTLRSRAAICDACLDLIQGGVLQPSADQIAARAGLSRRSVFNHFKDLAELYDAVLDAGMQRCAPLLAEARVDANMALDQRIDLWTSARANFLEAAGPFTRALMAQALSTDTRDQALRVSREASALQRREVEQLFAPELAELPRPERMEISEAVSAAASPLAWEHLRHGRDLPLERARQVMTRGVRALLAGPARPGR